MCGLRYLEQSGCVSVSGQSEHEECPLAHDRKGFSNSFYGGRAVSLCACSSGNERICTAWRTLFGMTTYLDVTASFWC